MKKDINILFVCGYYPDDLIEHFTRKSKIALDFAAQNLQTSIIDGFRENNQQTTVLSAPFLGSFPPFYKSPIVPKFIANDRKTISVSYLNISYIKRWYIRYKIWGEIKKWLGTTTAKNKFIIFYNFSSVSLSKKIKQIAPNTHITLLVTDLQEYMAVDNSIYTILNKKLNDNKREDISYHNLIDSYILLSTGMKERLPVMGKPWFLLEGIYNSKEFIDKVDKEETKVILYTGNLGKRYGIMTLLEAFSKIKSANYRLWICGSGEARPDIIAASKEDSRISYLGILTRKEVLKIQKKATLLVNPRSALEEYTKYSFPSKTMEYLASGTPTLMHKLECIPVEYDKYIYFFDNERADGMSEKIIEICEKPQTELNEFGKKAAEFIFQEKTPMVQVRKVLDFFNTLI